MSVEQAKNTYIGKGVPKRLNCAESVTAAFNEVVNLDVEVIKSFANCGGGKAPGGVCGSYHATKIILDKLNPSTKADYEAKFLSLAGSFKCKEIREKRTLSCIGCVTTSAEFIEETIKRQKLSLA